MSGAIRSTTSNLGLGVLNFNFPNWGDDANNNTKILDAAFQLAGVSVSGVWENATAYIQGQLLVDVDTNDPYRVLVSHTSASDGIFAADRVANPTYWELIEVNFHIRGEWAGATAYLVGDIVYDDSEHCVAVCIQSHTSTTTVRVDEAAGYWQFIADLHDAVLAAEAAAESAAESAEIAAGTVGSDLGPAIAGSPAKTALDDADRIGVTDSDTSHTLAHSTWGNMKALLAAINDAAYAELAHTHLPADVTGLEAALTAKAPIAAPSFTGAASIGGTLTLAADPLSGMQAATKQYVDGLVSGLGTRASVRAATTANIAIATALNHGDSLDGVTLVSGNFVLVKNQTAPAENGIYTVSPSPVRASEFDTYDEHVGAQINVQEGATNADSIWLSYANTGGTLNTTAITFVRLVTSGELLATNNLSDVSNAATAKTNLGISANGSELISSDYNYMRYLLGLWIYDSPVFNMVYFGTTSDTALHRIAAGYLAVAGNPVPSPPSQAVDDLLIRGATQWNRLPRGAASTYLRVNSAGNGVEYGALPPYQFLLFPASGGGTFFLISGITSNISMVSIAVDALSFTSNAQLHIQIGDSGGTETTGYTCQTTIIDTSGTTESTSTDSFALGETIGGSSNITGIITLQKTVDTDNRWTCAATTGMNGKIAVTVGTKELTGSLVHIFMYSNGNHEAGNVSMWFSE